MEPIQLAAISRLFSSSVVRELARKGRSPLFARLVEHSRLLSFLSRSSYVSHAFEAAFGLLKQQGHRDEYIYKTAVTQNILLGTHSLQTASMLNEFRVGDCKADIVILNGTATAYEVKSERDSLARLDRQVAAYLRVFASVYVIAAEDHLAAVKRIVPNDVGLMLLTRKLNISKVRDAVNAPDRTSPEAIFDCLRTVEAQMVLQSLRIAIPAVPNTALNSVLRELFLKLDAREAHECMVGVLKKTRNLLRLNELVCQLPRSLHSAALSVPLRKVDHGRLVAAMNTRLCDALGWA